ncbi:porin family protein [Soonwooa sp.]|uniref:porin family protein n=1 Tax=Soonwooa sp. TaxID=1938592 RepID=UPI0026323709|nr:porin family protein [Soonwooa sp.]
MKKLFMFLCVLSFSSILVNAQKKKSTKNSTKPKVEFGVKAGGNFSNFLGKDASRDFSYKFGYYGGFLVKYSFRERMSLQGEVLYDAMQSNSKERENGNTGFAEMSYVSVPILFQYGITDKIYIETGPNIGYNIKSQFTSVTYNNEVVDWKYGTKKMNFAWALGGGYNITNNLAANLRANIGAASPFKNIEKRNSEKIRLMSFELGLTYYFK